MSPRLLAVLLAAAGLLTIVPPSFAVEAALHPFCVQQLVRITDAHFEGETDRPLPAEPCNQHYRKAPIEARGEFYYAEMKPLGEKDPPFYAYRVVGYHRNITIVNVAKGSGGASVYSALAFFTGWPVSDSRDSRDAGAQVTLVGMFEGGDRCNGGIAEVKMTSPSTLQLGESLTPYDLFVFRATRALRRDKERVFYSAVENEDIPPISDKLLALEPDQDLDTAPASCIGVATTEFDLESGTSHLVSVTLSKLIDGDPGWVAKHTHQACFNRVVKAEVPSFPKTLSPEEVRALSETFETECLK